MSFHPIRKWRSQWVSIVIKYSISVCHGYDSALCVTILHAYSMSKGTRKVVELDPIKVAAC